jgi:hypothetical protein
LLRREIVVHACVPCSEERSLAVLV